jgi:hypothetical protein
MASLGLPEFSVKVVRHKWRESQGNTLTVRVFVLGLVKIAKTIAPKEIE